MDNKEEKKYLVYPDVGIVIVVSREREHPDWVKECVKSCSNQDYEKGKVHLRIIDNNMGLKTIGRAYNQGVKSMPDEVKWVLFVNDDDFISIDYIRSCVIYAEEMCKKHNNIIGASTYLTLFEEKEVDKNLYKRQEARELAVNGMWNREWLLKNPFVETQIRYVDTELMDRADQLGMARPILTWHYGYYYRSHDGQISYKKSFGGNHANLSGRSSEIREMIRAERET